MNFNFKFNHGNLNILQLHQNGIRSWLEIEEVIQGDSFAEELPAKVAFSLDLEGTIITLQAKIATVLEIKEGFCKHCK